MSNDAENHTCEVSGITFPVKNGRAKSSEYMEAVKAICGFIERQAKFYGEQGSKIEMLTCNLLRADIIEIYGCHVPTEDSK